MNDCVCNDEWCSGVIEVFFKLKDVELFKFRVTPSFGYRLDSTSELIKRHISQSMLSLCLKKDSGLTVNDFYEHQVVVYGESYCKQMFICRDSFSISDVDEIVFHLFTEILEWTIKLRDEKLEEIEK